jgi:hypothetical protein
VQHKHLPLYLDGDLYSRLERRARAEDRDPIQQARWLIRRALEADKTEKLAVTAREAVRA